MDRLVSGKSEIKIGIFGVGNGGGNIINYMIEDGVRGAEFYAVNTDRAALNLSLAKNKIAVGSSLTEGFGSGDDPEVARKACEESEDKIREIAVGLDLAFLIACLGGGVGAGATPFLARALKQAGSLVAAIVIKPFRHEGKFKGQRALRSLAELRAHIDTRMVIANDSIFEQSGIKTMSDALRSINALITEAVRGVIDMLNTTQMVNIDFADLRSVISEKGLSVIATGIGIGANRAREAAEEVLNSPLLDSGDLRECKRMLINVMGDERMTAKEVQIACATISERLSDNTLIRCGYGRERNLRDKMRVTVVAGGMEERLENYLDIDGIIRDLENVMPVKRGDKIDLSNREIPAFLRLRQKVD